MQSRESSALYLHVLAAGDIAALLSLSVTVSLSVAQRNVTGSARFGPVA